jgi:hypothetical protein
MLVCINTYGSDELSEGPGVFTGNKGAFSLSQLLASKGKESPPTKTQELSVPEAKDEFELFKLWHHSKTESTAEYQQFLIWLKYQHYLKSKHD